MQQFNTPKLKFLYRTIILFLITFTLYRLVFLAVFKNEITTYTKDHLFHALFMGFKFDMRLIAILLLPGILFINIPINPKFKQNFLILFYSLLFLIITLLYGTDIGYFSYLRSRINATVVAFLANPIISFQMVSQSYPWFKGLIALIILGALFYFIFKKFIVSVLDEVKTENKLSIKISRMVLFIFIFALSAYGSFQMYPLRWSEAFNSPDAFSSNLSLNPILYIADTYSFRKTDFDSTELKKYYSEVADYLGVEKPDVNNLNFLREYPGKPEIQKLHPNVVFIIMESLGYYKTGLGGSKVDPTPYLDLMAKESLLYPNFYTPTVATARSVFAAITSLPDVSKVQSGTRNPFIVNQNTIMGQAKDYEKFYFLGGSANWGNIRGVLSHNIPGLNIFEEGSYSKPRVDVWGISDLNLFKEAAAEISKHDANKKPFFAIIQSAGFHRPYTIPNDSDDFKLKTDKDIDPKLVADYGFESMQEYNAMRLQDYSLGKFFELAKKSNWYNNTIFIVIGDHSLPHNNAKNVFEWQKYMANGYHVPLIIHSPKYVKSGVEKKIASELDVMPTIAGLIGIPYKTRSLGRDLNDPKFENKAGAFSYNWYAPFHLTMVNKNYYFEYIPYNGNSQLINYSLKDNTDNIKDKEPAVKEQMERLTKGLYEASKYLLYNNPKTY